MMDCCTGDTTLISSSGVFGVWALRMKMATNKKPRSSHNVLQELGEIV